MTSAAGCSSPAAAPAAPGWSTSAAEQILASYQFVAPIPGANNTFINDVVLTPDGAYYTDSRSAVLFHLPLGRHGRLPAQDEVRQIPLSGDWAPNAEGVAPSANGIARTPDGRALIVVASNFGALFRVDPRTGVATAIDLGGETVVNGDGLLLDGRTLYVVQNRLNTVAVIRLNHRGTAGTVEQRVTDPRFDVPTTVAAFGDRLYLPNARFGIAVAGGRHVQRGGYPPTVNRRLPGARLAGHRAAPRRATAVVVTPPQVSSGSAG